MYSAPDLPRSSAGAPGDGANGGSQPIAQLAAALVELAETQRATDQKLAQLVNISRQTIGMQEELAVQIARSTPVTVKDINMTFGAMVMFMVKWAVAAIPAAIILVVLWSLVTVFGAAMLAVLAR